MQKTAIRSGIPMAILLSGPSGRQIQTKTRLVMRLIALLPTIAFLTVQASGSAQSLTLSGKNIPLKKVASTIEKETGYFVFYDAGLLSAAKPVTLNVTNVPLRQFLDSLVKDQPFTYRITNKTISIVWRDPSAVDRINSIVQDHVTESTKKVLTPVTGIVRGPDGKPLAGVSVSKKKTKKGTTTDSKGTFALSADPGDVLVFSSIGYLTREITVGDKTDLGTVSLAAHMGELDKTVVIAYGTTSRRLNTGSVSTVTAEDLEKQPVLNPMLALRGLVPGLVVTPSGGYASSPVKLLVRGRNNINTNVSSEPLILIDGMPITTLNLDGTDQTNGANILPSLARYNIGTGTSTGGESPLFGLNPKDIETITVLKDADATAIYGSRGANGVILISTKKAKAHPTEFNLNMSEGISKVTRRYKMMNTTQYLQMRREALKNDGVALNAGNLPEQFLWDTTRNVDWQKELWGGTGKVTNATAGLSGGTNNTSFRLSGNFARQTEILTVSGGSKAANLALSLNHHTTDQKFSADFSTIYTHGSTEEVNQTGQASILPPDAPPIYNKNGALNYAEWEADGFMLFGDFPFSSLLQTSKSSTNTVNSNLALSYRPIKGLELRASIGYRTTVNNSQAFNPIIAQDPINNPRGSAQFTTVNSGGWIFEPQLNYTHPAIGPGKLSVLVGASVQSSDSRYNVEQGQGYTNDLLLKSIGNAPQQSAYDAYGQYKYSGVFARLNYDIANKYVLNLNGRRDGSSRFGPGLQFGNFGSVGAAWVISEEKWLRRILPTFISFLKFRGSYGITGSDGVGDYQYLSQWVAGVGNSLLPSYNGVSRPIVTQHPVNQYFHWQANKQLTEGIEMDLLPDSRITLTLEHYRNRCSNQLLQYPTAVLTGFSGVTANWPATVQNSGYEVSVSANLISNKDFKWTVSGNISFNTNKLQKYDGILNSPYFSRLLVGKSLSASYLYHYVGIDPLTGVYAFQDYNHDGVLTTNGLNYPPLSKNLDNQKVVNLNPKYSGGFATTLSYKGMGLSLLFDYLRQMGKNAYAQSGVPGALLQNVPAEFANNHWQKPGDHATYMLYTVGYSSQVAQALGAFGSSDGVYTDASFIRLSNVSFSYNLPEKTAKKMGMRGCNIYINAQNVYTFTKYKGTDPELQSFSAMPQAKIITGGISFNF